MDTLQAVRELFRASSGQLVILGHIAIAMVLGSLIGFERERLARPAGLRTHMLVAGAAALFVSLGNILVQEFNLELDRNAVRTDPLRVIEAVVTGVSFLGAGTIIRNSGEVRGLTTAASLLFSAALGVAVVLNQFILAVGLTAFGLLILRGLRKLER